MWRSRWRQIADDLGGSWWSLLINMMTGQPLRNLGSAHPNVALEIMCLQTVVSGFPLHILSAHLGILHDGSGGRLWNSARPLRRKALQRKEPCCCNSGGCGGRLSKLMTNLFPVKSVSRDTVGRGRGSKHKVNMSRSRATVREWKSMSLPRWSLRRERMCWILRLGKDFLRGSSKRSCLP